MDIVIGGIPHVKKDPSKENFKPPARKKAVCKDRRKKGNSYAIKLGLWRTYSSVAYKRCINL